MAKYSLDQTLGVGFIYDKNGTATKCFVTATFSKNDNSSPVTQYHEVDSVIPAEIDAALQAAADAYVASLTQTAPTGVTIGTDGKIVLT